MPTVVSHFFMASIRLVQRANPASAKTLAVSLIRDWVMGGLFVQPLRGTRPSQYHHSSHPGVSGALLGQDSDTPNSVVFAIILGVIGHPESPKKQFIESATQDFVICPEHDRSELLQASEQGHLLHLPLPLGAAVDLRSLPGYISLNPVDNPDGFESTWLDYFVFIFNLLCFEATTSHNIGELESKLHQFQLSSDSFSSHPFHQKHCETTTQWAARISHAHREVIAACAKAQCSSRSPSDSQLASLVYACVLPSTWEIADLIMRERNIHPQTFQEAISLMLDAERRVHHQDPKVTLTRRLRAHQPGPTAPLTPSPPPSAVPSTIPATTLQGGKFTRFYGGQASITYLK